MLSLMPDIHRECGGNLENLGGVNGNFWGEIDMNLFKHARLPMEAKSGSSHPKSSSSTGSSLGSGDYIRKMRVCKI